MMPNDKIEGVEIRFEDRDGYLYVFISGKEESVSLALKYWQYILEECKKLGFERLLVEENFPNQLCATDMYTITSSIPKMGHSGLKIAFVDRVSEHNKLNLFGETVAVNRGVNGRVFAEIADAEAWLKS